jgi:hypothetical protein
MLDDGNKSIIEDGKSDPNNELKGADEDSAIDSEDAASGSLFCPEDVGPDVDEDEVPGTPGQTQLGMPSLCDLNGSPICLVPASSAAPARQTSPRCKAASASAEEAPNQSALVDTVTEAGSLAMSGLAGTSSVRGGFVALPPRPLSIHAASSVPAVVGIPAGLPVAAAYLSESVIW